MGSDAVGAADAGRACACPRNEAVTRSRVAAGLGRASRAPPRPNADRADRLDQGLEEVSTSVAAPTDVLAPTRGSPGGPPAPAALIRHPHEAQVWRIEQKRPQIDLLGRLRGGGGEVAAAAGRTRSRRPRPSACGGRPGPLRKGWRRSRPSPAARHSPASLPEARCWASRGPCPDCDMIWRTSPSGKLAGLWRRWTRAPLAWCGRPLSPRAWIPRPVCGMVGASAARPRDEGREDRCVPVPLPPPRGRALPRASRAGAGPRLRPVGRPDAPVQRGLGLLADRGDVRAGGGVPRPYRGRLVLHRLQLLGRRARRHPPRRADPLRRGRR